MSNSEQQQLIVETHAGFAALRADPQAWAAELAEREIWEKTLADGLDSLDGDQPDAV